jgi:hypothetical protein
LALGGQIQGARGANRKETGRGVHGTEEVKEKGETRRTPEVVRRVSRNDLLLRHSQTQPQLLGLQVGRKSKTALEVGKVEAVFGEAVDFGQEGVGEFGRLGL